jgi:hypothetical protein
VPRNSQHAQTVLYDPCERVHVWYVVFEDEAVLPCYARPFVRDGFRHVYAMRAVKKRGRPRALIVNQVAQGLLVDVCRQRVEDCALAELDAGRTVVQVAGRLQPRYTLRVTSCVGVVKSLLGIHAWHVWTPWQLYKYLISAGGQDLCAIVGKCSEA